MPSIGLSIGRTHWRGGISGVGDSTPPTLSNPVDAKASTTTGTGSVDTDEGNGTLYWVVSTSATPPTATQVKAGQMHTGAAAADSGSQAVSGTGTQSITGGFTGLTSNTQYYAHYMQEDTAANQSSVSSADGFITYEELNAGNIVANPSDLNNATWQKTDIVSVTSNAANGPNGDAIADKVIPSTASSSNHNISDLSLTTTAASWTFRARAKANGYNYLELIIGNSTGYTKYYTMTFDLSNGTTGTSRSATYTGTAAIVALGDGWYRCSITVTVDANSTHRVDFHISDTSDPIHVYTGDGTSGVLGCMAEFYPT